MPFISTRSASALAVSASLLGLVSAVWADKTVPVAMPLPPNVSTATLVGRVAPSTVLKMSLSLAPADRGAFAAYADAVSDPKSPDYHRFLTPAQIGERFGAPKATVDSIAAYLKGKGMAITQVGDTRLAILFSGNASAVESAFSTKFVNYRDGTRAFYSYSTVPQLPSAFAGKVVSIGGLQNAYVRTPLYTLTPAQSRGLYGAAGLYRTGNKGEGVTVGITNLGDGYRLSNLPIFYSTYGLPAPKGGVGANVSHVSVAGIDGSTQSEGIETNLDIQMVLAEAPSAKVIVYDGWTDLVSIAAREVQDNLIDIASESWVFSDSPDVLEAMNDQHVAMTLEGITYMAGTGDWGADESRGNYPHAYPDVIAIGGTDATVSDAEGTRAEEKGWYYSGAGWEPGTYPFNHLPSYQRGALVPQNLDKRLFPDLSLQAAGSLMVAGGQVVGVGGTSSSGPQFAGQLALILERLKTEGAADSVGGHFRLGRIHDLVYSLNGLASVFYDVDHGDAEFTLPDGTVPQSKVGWDYVTGWGAPIAQGLHDALFAAGSIAVADAPNSATIYKYPSTTTPLGTPGGGDVSALPTSDGVSYLIDSVKQNGLGQVAALEVVVPLQTAKTRRSASVSVVMGSPNLTTEYVYLMNRTTGLYDLAQTLVGTGAMATTTISLDLSGTAPYIQADGQGEGARARGQAQPSWWSPVPTHSRPDGGDREGLPRIERAPDRDRPGSSEKMDSRAEIALYCPMADDAPGNVRHTLRTVLAFPPAQRIFL